MSTFGGKLREFDSISLDRFDGINLKSTAFFLSHFHKDHTVGLSSEKLTEQLKNGNGKRFLYCSEVTRLLLMADPDYVHLDQFIKTLRVNEDTLISVPDLCGVKTTAITVTLLDAHHCPGSVMFLIQGKGSRVLYTGDFRWPIGTAKEHTALHHTDGSLKSLDALYIDTTFCFPEASYIPSHDDCVNAVEKLCKEWIYKTPHHTVCIASSVRYGHENLIADVARNLNQRVHTSDTRKALLQLIDDLGEDFWGDVIRVHTSDTRKALLQTIDDLGEVFCGDETSQLHACYHSQCSQVREAQTRDHLLTIRPSTMWFIHHTTAQRAVVATRRITRVCYCFHSSYSEVRDVVRYLNPTRVYPNVVPPDHKDSHRVQGTLIKFLKTRDRSPSPEARLGKLRKPSSTVSSRTRSPTGCDNLQFGTPEKCTSKTNNDAIESLSDGDTNKIVDKTKLTNSDEKLTTDAENTTTKTSDDTEKLTDGNKISADSQISNVSSSYVPSEVGADWSDLDCSQKVTENSQQNSGDKINDVDKMDNKEINKEEVSKEENKDINRDKNIEVGVDALGYISGDSDDGEYREMFYSQEGQFFGKFSLMKSRSDDNVDNSSEKQCEDRTVTTDDKTTKELEKLTNIDVTNVATSSLATNVATSSLATNGNDVVDTMDTIINYLCGDEMVKKSTDQINLSRDKICTKSKTSDIPNLNDGCVSLIEQTEKVVTSKSPRNLPKSPNKKYKSVNSKNKVIKPNKSVKDAVSNNIAISKCDEISRGTKNDDSSLCANCDSNSNNSVNLKMDKLPNCGKCAICMAKPNNLITTDKITIDDSAKSTIPIKPDSKNNQKSDTPKKDPHKLTVPPPLNGEIIFSDKNTPNEMIMQEITDINDIFDDEIEVMDLTALTNDKKDCVNIIDTSSSENFDDSGKVSAGLLMDCDEITSSESEESDHPKINGPNNGLIIVLTSSSSSEDIENIADKSKVITKKRRRKTAGTKLISKSDPKAKKSKVSISSSETVSEVTLSSMSSNDILRGVERELDRTEQTRLWCESVSVQSKHDRPTKAAPMDDGGSSGFVDLTQDSDSDCIAYT